MSKENETIINGQVSENGQAGEITTIREILMGSHLGAYEKRFAEIERRLGAIEDKLSQSYEQTVQNIEKLNTTLQTDFTSRLEKVENHFKETNQNDKQELSKLFSEISNRLLK